VPGSGIVLSGITWEGAGSGVDISGSDVRLTRCAVRNIDNGDRQTTARAAIRVANDPGETTRAVTIDRCEISGYGVTGILVEPNGTIGDVTIERNHIHDGALTGAERLNPGHAISLGKMNEHREKPIAARVLFNYIERHHANQVIQMKSSDNLVAFNRIVVTPGKSSRIAVRHGRNNRIVGNDVSDGVISTFDYAISILGNKAAEIWLEAGNISSGYSYDQLPNRKDAGYSTLPASRYARVAGNFGTLVVGRHLRTCFEEPTAVEGAAIYKHVGEVRFVEQGCAPWHKDVVVDAESEPPADWGWVPDPVRLSVSEVGPFSK
jgi:hypothetical protein